MTLPGSISDDTNRAQPAGPGDYAPDGSLGAPVLGAPRPTKAAPTTLATAMVVPNRR